MPPAKPTTQAAVLKITRPSLTGMGSIVPAAVCMQPNGLARLSVFGFSRVRVSLVISVAETRIRVVGGHRQRGLPEPVILIRILRTCRLYVFPTFLSSLFLRRCGLLVEYLLTDV